MEQDQNQLRQLRNYLERTRGNRYPFPDHRLSGEEHYLKNLYLKHLCLILRCGKGVSETQSLFLQRLIAGCGAEYDPAAYMRQSQDITPETLEEFLGRLEPGGLLEPFLLDVLLLTHLGEEDEERQELAAELCEASRIPLDKLEALAQLCGEVLRLNLAECVRVCLEHPNVCSLNLVNPYLPAVSSRTQSVTENALVVAGGCSLQSVNEFGTEEAFTQNISWLTYYNAKSFAFREHSDVCFYRLRIPVDAHLRFCNTKRVSFIGCTFEAAGGKPVQDSPSIWFDQCGEIVFRGCSFRNFSGRMIYTLSCNTLLMENCAMENCVMKYVRALPNNGWTELGSMIYTADSTALTLRNCRFSNCGGWNSVNACYHASSILSNCPSKIFGCRFENCWNVYGNHTGGSVPVKDPDDSKRCLFWNILAESGNEVVDSAELGPH